MPKNVISLNNLSFSYQGYDKEVLSISNLTVEKGNHIFIQGASGSGKTTLLNLMTGINVPNKGDINILDNNLALINQLKRDQFRADHIGVIFQQFNLLPYLSLLENVKLPCWFSKKRKQKAGNLDETARDLLSELKISEKLHHKPVNTLSTGQQQRVAVARALIGKPEIIIADEPTSALDAGNRDSFLTLLFSEAEQQDSTIIFVSHDLGIAEHFPVVVQLSEINKAV